MAQQSAMDQMNNAFGSSARNNTAYNNAANNYNKDAIKASATAVKTISDNTIKSYKDMYTKLTKMNDTFLKGKLKQEVAYQKQLARIQQGSAMNSYGSLDSVTNKVTNSIENAFNDVSNTSAPKIGKNIGESFVKAATPLFEKLFNLFKSGIDSYLNAYESTFTSIAGRTGAGYYGTRGLYKSSRNAISSNDLNNVVNISSDMIPAMQQAAQQGFKGEALTQKALNDSIAKYIMPWLETNSEAYVQLTYNLSDYQMKALKGQDLQLQKSEAGNRLLQTGVIQQLTEQMTPLLQTMTINTSEEYRSQITDITAQLMQAGYSREEASAQASAMVKNRLNPYAALTSGSLSDKLYAVALSQGMSEYGAYNASYGRGIGIAQGINNMFGSGAVLSQFGITNYMSEAGARGYGVSKVGNTGLVTANAETAKSEYDIAKENAEYNKTATKRLQTIIDNIAALPGEFISAIPFGMTILAGLAKVFGGKEGILNAGKSLIGKTSLAKGISSFGAAASAEVTGVGAGMGNALSLAGSATSMLPAIGGGILTALVAIVLGKDGLQKVGQSLKSGVSSIFDSVVSAFTDKSKTFPQKISNIIGTALGSIIGTLATLGEGLISGVKRIGSDVKSLVTGKMTIGDIFSNMFSGIGGSYVEGFSSGFESSYKTSKPSHAGGLSYVPYDGYTATLHEGERVLTKTENEAYSQAVSTSGAIAGNEQLIEVVKQVSAAIVDAIYNTSSNNSSPYGALNTKYDSDITHFKSGSLVKTALAK